MVPLVSMDEGWDIEGRRNQIPSEDVGGGDGTPGLVCQAMGRVRAVPTPQ